MICGKTVPKQFVQRGKQMDSSYIYIHTDDFYMKVLSEMNNLPKIHAPRTQTKATIS